MGESKAINAGVSPAVPTFNEVLAEFFTLSGANPNPKIIKQISQDGEVSINEFHRISPSDVLFYQITADMRSAITIFNLGDAMKKLKCNLGIHPNPAMCEAPKVTKIRVETKTVKEKCDCGYGWTY